MFSLMDLSVYPSIVRWMEQCKGLAGYDKSHAAVLKLAPKIKKVRGVRGLGHEHVERQERDRDRERDKERKREERDADRELTIRRRRMNEY